MRKTSILVAFLLGLSVPAVADHITEPTAPVTGLTVRMYAYGGGEDPITACDGSEMWTLDKMRIEPDVHVAAKPSEHWTLRVRVSQPNPDYVIGKDKQTASPSLKQWDDRPTHQNHGPHTHKPEAGQVNQYQMLDHSGIWTVEANVRGDVSGNFYEFTCQFQTP